MRKLSTGRSRAELISSYTYDPADGVLAAAPAPAEKPDAGADTPKPSPIDEDGNVDNNAVCASPDCGHYASAHEDTEDGENRGGCGMRDCECLEFKPDSGLDDDDINPPDDAQDDGTDGDERPVKLAAEPSVPAEESEPAGEPDGDEVPEGNEPPDMGGGASMGPAFTIPVAIIEGQQTGDGRMIAEGALSWRTPPLPLMGLATETHDPEGFDMNDPAVICGRIDSLERAPGDGGTQVIVAKGFYLPNDDGMYFAELNEAMGRLGVSADVAVQASEVTVGDIDEMGFPTDMSETLTEGTIMGLTVCPYPAFEGAYIVLGDGAEPPEAIPQQAEAPPAPVAAGGQLVHLISYEECEPCDQDIEIVTASGAGPVRPPAGWFENPNFTADDGRLVEIIDRRGLGGKFACPITVTDEGRVYGHLAPWDVCHIGRPGCVTAPHSAADYAYFKRGQHVVTAEGDRIRVGVLTCDANHAPQTRATGPAAAMAHYDNTALAVADVNVGEDEHGIWVAGAIRPGATDEQIRNLRAASISGDWRSLGGQLELVAALAVPVPGFPLAPRAVVAGGQVRSLTASGVQVMHAVKHPVVDDSPAVQALRIVRSREKLQRLAAGRG